MMLARCATALPASPETLQNADLITEANQSDGTYSIRSATNSGTLTARFGAKINGKWVFSTQYPHHRAVLSQSTGSLDETPQIEMTNSGLIGEPDITLYLRLHHDPSYVEIQVEVPNNASSGINIEGFRLMEVHNSPAVSLGPSESSERVLSDSWSEDRPSMRIRDLADAPDSTHRGVGSQLIYNRESKSAFFAAALTSDKWLTVMRLRTSSSKAKTVGYEIDSTGTTELTRENSLAHSGLEDQIELSLPLKPGHSLSSERVMLTFGSDCNVLLENYGDLIRRMHHARIDAPTPIGWWSWTAYYFGLNEGSALTNANFLAERLKDKGYQYFHIDEGYQYARGEYATTNADKFRHGMDWLERNVQDLGLTPGLWTAPFEVSERSWVYQNHKDWLVRNKGGQAIHAGRAAEDRETKKPLDLLFVLDATNPGAQRYLRQTYATLTRDWGIRYVKLDFMEDSAVEGIYYRPHTTALEAQRIGLQVIRDAVGDDVLLDKDGSPMLNPVGLVDAGRISVDTGHSFEASKEAAPGIAARFYMNRNFFISDPDAFGISRQFLLDEPWHGGKRPITDDEAKVSIALSAVSGGMFEIGDDLPTLFLDPQRMALVENRDLINMARLGRASKPIDLMTYAPEDGMPTTFFLRESKRQSVVTVFNWTDTIRHRRIGLDELGLGSTAHNQLLDIFAADGPAAKDISAIDLDLPPRSVRMFKIVDSGVAATAPSVTARVVQEAQTGVAVEFSATADGDAVPAVAYSWDFGDGTSARESTVKHTFTHEGIFSVSLRVEGIDGDPFEESFPVKVAGQIGTRFNPADFERVPPKN
jgi:PKD repeat protein